MRMKARWPGLRWHEGIFFLLLVRTWNARPTVRQLMLPRSRAVFPSFLIRGHPFGSCRSRVCRGTNMHAPSLQHQHRLTVSRESGPAVILPADRCGVKLTQSEQELFGTLLRVVREEDLGTTLRVAGGWVRDKLLSGDQGAGEVDVDITLDNMMGSEFASRFNDWLGEHGLKQYKVAIISRNPEKSKHLETATMRVGDFSIDFVNLRTESYTEQSRIPKMEIGTPEEDACRRDLTINALFYNINTQMVEDYCGQGITDIQNRIIRTPLPPFTTLLDDPLRVLRAIRFASRLDFDVSHDLIEAARNSRIHQALAQKVSRERVGHEVDLMMRSVKPSKAMGLIDSLWLADTVFPMPPNVAGSEVEPDWFKTGLRALLEMEAGLRARSWGLSSDEARLALYASLLLPLATTTCPEPKGRNKEAAVSKYLLAISLKVKARDAERVGLLHEVVQGFQPFLQPDGLEAPDSADMRASIGTLIIQSGPLWRAALLLAAVKCHLEDPQPSYSYRDAATRVLSYVEEASLESVWEMQPLLDGMELKRLLPGLPHGPPFKEVVDTQVQLMLRCPNHTRESMRKTLTEVFPRYMQSCAKV